MSKKKKEVYRSKEDLDFLNEFKHSFDISYLKTNKQREKSLLERKMLAVPGSLWDGDYGKRYGDNKIRLDVNRFNVTRNRIEGEYRNTRFNVDFVAKGFDNSEKSDWIDGIYMADFYDSNGQDAVDNAFIEAYTGGFGAWRLCNEYQSKKNEEQRIAFHAIHDADQRVFFDPDSIDIMKQDAQWGAVITNRSKEWIKREYDIESITPFNNSSSIGYSYNWFSYIGGKVSSIALCELYQKRETTKIFSRFDNILNSNSKFFLKEDLDQDIIDMLKLDGYEYVGEEKKESDVVEKIVLCGDGILEKKLVVAGEYIPIVPVWGKRDVVDSIELWNGYFTWAKDAAILQNIQVSSLAHLAATSSLNKKPIFDPAQLADEKGYIKELWNNDQRDDKSYMLSKSLYDQNGAFIRTGPEYTQQSDVPPALGALINISDTLVKEAVGFGQNETVTSQMSGVAIDLIQQQKDIQTVILIDNLKKSYVLSGKIWISQASDLYVEEGRKMKSAKQSGTTEYITINTDVSNKSGAINKLSFENHESDIIVTTGPTTISKKASMAKMFTEMAMSVDDQELKRVFTLLATENYDTKSDVQKWVRKQLVNIGIYEPNEEEKLAMQQQAQQPNPNDMLLQSAARQADAEADKAAAQAVNIRMDSALKVNEADKTKAETMKILNEIDSARMGKILEIIKNNMDLLKPNNNAQSNDGSGFGMQSGGI